MAIGRTLTKQLTVEARQHEILGLDLGEGPKRSTIALGLAAVIIWSGVCLLVIGPPTADTLTLYLLPPGVALGMGLQEDAQNPRRTRLTGWALRIRYVLIGHRPILALGTTPARRGEMIPARFRLVGPAVAARLPFPTEWFVPDDIASIGRPRRDRPLRLAQTARLYGTDHLARAIEKKAKTR